MEVSMVFYIFDQDWTNAWIDPIRKWLIYKVLWNSIQPRGLNNIFRSETLSKIDRLERIYNSRQNLNLK
jgi:hypothetical protein